MAVGILDVNILKHLARGERAARKALDLAVQRSEADFDDPLLEAVMHSGFGKAYFGIGVYPEAEKHLRAALELRRQAESVEPGDFKDLADSLNSLGECLREMGEASNDEGVNDYQAAAELHQEALGIAERHLGPDHLETARSLHDLGAAHWWLKEYAVARPLYERALKIRKRYGEETQEVADSYDHLAACMDQMGEGAAAEAYYRRALDIREKLDSTIDFDRGVMRHKLALCLLKQNRHAEAAPLFAEALEIIRAAGWGTHPWVGRVLHSQGLCFEGMSDLVSAEAALREALEHKRKYLAPQALSTARTLHELAKIECSTGRCAQAEKTCLEALEIQGVDPESAESRDLLGMILTRLERFAEAEAALLQALEALQARWGREDARTQNALQHMVELYEAWEKPDQAEAYRALLLETP